MSDETDSQRVIPEDSDDRKKKGKKNSYDVDLNDVDN